MNFLITICAAVFLIFLLTIIILVAVLDCQALLHDLASERRLSKATKRAAAGRK